jgi:prefoldin subunit 5
LKSKTLESSENYQKVQQFDYEVENYKRKIKTLESKMGDINEMTDKIFQYESKISKMNYQIESFSR